MKIKININQVSFGTILNKNHVKKSFFFALSMFQNQSRFKSHPLESSILKFGLIFTTAKQITFKRSYFKVVQKFPGFPSSNGDKNRYFKKVSKSRKQFMVSSILPKNERNLASSLLRILSFVRFLVNFHSANSLFSYSYFNVILKAAKYFILSMKVRLQRLCLLH